MLALKMLLEKHYANKTGRLTAGSLETWSRLALASQHWRQQSQQLTVQLHRTDFATGSRNSEIFDEL